MVTKWRLARVLGLGLAFGLAACGNEEAELAEKAKQEQTAFSKGLAAYNAGDFPTALAVLKPLADAGNPSAQNNIGRMYYDGKGVPENDAEAVKWFQLAADKGHPTAQFNLGAAYEYGNGVQQNIEEALRWYGQAAKQGEPEAQVNLGRMYDEGLGVAQNPLAALRLFNLAAARGVAEAQFDLGVLYSAGRAAPKNDAEAMKWYRRAADQGFAEAQYSMGNIFEDGTGVMQDYAEAMRWYRLAAAQGHAGAQNNIGRLYADGLGVPKDNVKVLMWYNVALPGLRGEEASNALAFRDGLASGMRRQQVAAGRSAGGALPRVGLQGLRVASLFCIAQNAVAKGNAKVMDGAAPDRSLSRAQINRYRDKDLEGEACGGRETLTARSRRASRWFLRSQFARSRGARRWPLPRRRPRSKHRPN